MHQVQEVKKIIQGFNTIELTQFREWFYDYAPAWDAQIEEDVKEGRLDSLAARAADEYKKGLCTEI